MKMKYLQGRKGMELVFREKEIPKPGYNEVLVKVSSCGVCGSDLHLLANSEEWTPLGHEISGEVVELGSGVTNVAVGEQVVVEDLAACGRCPNCKNGRTYLCTDMIGLQGQSGMGEYICVNERMLNPYTGLASEIACLTEPLAVCLNVYMKAKIPPEGDLVIFGLGSLAITTAALARHYGVGRIVCVGSRRGTARNQKRESVARAYGVDDVYYMTDEGWDKALKAAQAQPIHSIIVTSPPSTLPDAMRIADYGTQILPIGLDMGKHPQATINVDHMIQNKNPVLPFIAEPAKAFPLSMELLKKRVIDGENIITHRIDFNDAEELRDIFSQDTDVIKAILVM